MTKLRKFDNITPTLISLHWLPVDKIILFQLLIITFKTIHGLAPAYLSELITIYEPKRSLRTKNKANLLIVPKYNTNTYGQRTFSIAAPTEWNKLPELLRLISDFYTFKRKLKTFLFKLAYEC